LAATTMTSHAIEEPDFEDVQRLDAVEIRQYVPYVVAEVTVPGPADSAGNQAFPLLFGYISGKNKGERKMAMTAPVTQSPTPVMMAMTAPVTQAATLQGYQVQFVLPKGVTLESAPEPLDSRVKIREVPAAKVAAVRFSGFWSEDNYQRHLTQLTTGLQAAGMRWTGEPVYSRYNAPMTPWFLRRNEIWVALE
ncbi:MAG: SOUL family heme-binding protein, partial [Betaproteobacteria bacterium]